MVHCAAERVSEGCGGWQGGLPEVHEEYEGDAIAGAEAAVGESDVVDGDVLVGCGFVSRHFDRG